MYLELQTKKYGTIKFQISEQDLELVQTLKLYVSHSKLTNSKYLMTKDRKYLHRIIMNAKKGDVIDHINHDTLDNRRENLRIVTHSENKRNSLKAYKDTQKLTKEQVKTILLSTKTNNQLAKEYSVSNCLISKIRTGEMYKDYYPEISRRKNKGRGEILSLPEKKKIKKLVMNSKISLYQLSKKLNIQSNRLYQIRKGTIWKNI